MFGVAVGVTIVVAVLTVDHNTLREYAARFHRAYAAPDIEVIGESFAPGDEDPNLPVLLQTPDDEPMIRSDDVEADLQVRLAFRRAAYGSGGIRIRCSSALKRGS